MLAVTEEPDKPVSAFSHNNNEPLPEFGPAMRALRPRQQRAVMALFQTRGNRTEAMRLAGYGHKTAASFKSHASSFFQQDNVRAAVREVAEREISLAEPELLALVWEIARDTGESARDRLRAMAMLFDRANPILHKHQINVQHHLSADELDVTHYRALQKLGAPQQAFLDRFGVNGIERVKQLVYLEDKKQERAEKQQAIDGEFEEVINE